MLVAPPSHHPDLQVLVNVWHQQNVRHGLTEAAAWLYMQLPRFDWRSDQPVKTSLPYHFADNLQVPVFTSPMGMDVEWVSYRVVAYIQHHGLTPRTGHYTTILATGERHWLLDDEKSPCELAPDSYEHACHNIYSLVLAHSQMRSSSSNPRHTARVSAPRHEASVSSQCLSNRYNLADGPTATSGSRAPKDLN